jgi:hypothetical protein
MENNFFNSLLPTQRHMYQLSAVSFNFIIETLKNEAYKYFLKN